VKTDDSLEALTQASRGENAGWDKLLGSISSWRESVVDDDDQSSEAVQVLPTASREDQLLAASHHIMGGSLKKASTQLTSLGVAPNNGMVRRQLKEMNPKPFQPYPTMDDRDLPLWSLSTSQVKKQLLALRNDSAPGPSSMGVTALKRAASTEEGATAIARITNRIMNGLEPNKYRLTAANLIPLVKSETKIRPIACGEIFTRLAARCLLRHKGKDLAEFFAPIQMGVRQPGGAERIVHSIRTAYNRGNSVLNLDLSNAFNRISRAAIRTTLSEHFPSLLRYFDWSYGHAAPLWYDGGLFTHSCEGVRQGDPLGPALFAMGIHHVLVQLTQEFPMVKILAYLDDVTVTGDQKDLIRLSSRFKELIGECGLEMNPSKSVLCLHPGSGTPMGVGHLQVTWEGVWILGSPIGSRDFEGEQVLRKVERMHKMVILQSEKSIPVQHRYLLLRDCVLPSLNYLLRTVPPENRQKATSAFDSGIENVARVLLGTNVYNDDVSVDTCRQLFFPLRFGGLGLVPASFTSTAAFTASLWESGVQMDSDDASCLVAALRHQGVEVTQEDLEQPAPTNKQQETFMQQILRQKLNEQFQWEDEEGKGGSGLAHEFANVAL
jgi:hypothetical protein